VSSQPVPNGSTRKLNILRTEDNPVNRVLGQKILQKQGHTVTSSKNGKEAVQLWEQNQSRQFHIALMDIQMPKMGGNSFVCWKNRSASSIVCSPET
jgi:protein-histidine pros-kinase